MSIECDPILAITDGTTTIDLLRTFRLSDWTPALPEPKGGGVWNDNPFSHGRRMVFRRYGNIIDTFNLKLPGQNQDEIIGILRDLRSLLEKSSDYWTSEWASEPVYLIARGSQETNERYALIYDWRTPQDDNPFAQPFFGKRPMLDNFTLALEHGLWQDVIPGQSNATEICGTHSADAVETLTRHVGASTDDCKVNLITPAITLTDTTIHIYTESKSTIDTVAGIRFPNITIPQNAKIVGAYITFTAGHTYPGYPRLHFYYENTGNASTFSSIGDFTGRSWEYITNKTYSSYWYANQEYQSIDLTETLQELVDKGTWASGNGIAFKIESWLAPVGFYSWDHTSGAETVEPRIYIEYTASVTEYGQECSDNNLVYIANKHNFANLTHAHWYDASATPPNDWSDNLIGETTPFDLLPGTPAAGDMLYIGSTIGIFNSVVFDISTAQADLTTATWQYWDGSSWATLSVLDLTDATGDPLTATDVCSILWSTPSGWAKNTINTVEAYWIRLNVTVVGGSPTTPIQDNRDIYTVTTPYIEVREDQISGDLPALAKIMQYCKSESSTGTARGINRTILGVRSLDRGENFSAYINLADVQNQTGVTITDGPGTADADNVAYSPTGRVKKHTCTGANTWQNIVTVTLSNSLAGDYLGRFHVFLRGIPSADALSNLRLRLVFRVGSGTASAFTTEEAIPYASYGSYTNLIDFGIAVMPSFSEIIQLDAINEITITVQGLSSSASGTLDMVDLVLIPVDECAVDVYDSEKSTSNANRNTYPLSIDSVSYLKGRIRTTLKNVSGQHVNEWVTVAPDGLTLQSGKAQRVWFLFSNYLVSSYENSRGWLLAATGVSAVQRYLSMRGDS